MTDLQQLIADAKIVNTPPSVQGITIEQWKAAKSRLEANTTRAKIVPLLEELQAKRVEVERLLEAIYAVCFLGIQTDAYHERGEFSEAIDKASASFISDEARGRANKIVEALTDE